MIRINERITAECHQCKSIMFIVRHRSSVCARCGTFLNQKNARREMFQDLSKITDAYHEFRVRYSDIILLKENCERTSLIEFMDDFTLENYLSMIGMIKKFKLEIDKL
jgi:hypothetical protein